MLTHELSYNFITTFVEFTAYSSLGAKAAAGFECSEWFKLLALRTGIEWDFTIITAQGINSDKDFVIDYRPIDSAIADFHLESSDCISIPLSFLKKKFIYEPHWHCLRLAHRN